MKLLIIAGPYEADRLRRAAVAAGFETVAVEPGESLSGWIAASRPDLIVMAPRMVHPDPAVALAKVRAVPSGRVPTFLVGEKDDEDVMRGVGDGFFVRPVAPEDLLVEARRRVEQFRKPDSGSREVDFLPAQSHGSSPRSTPSLKPLVAERAGGGLRHSQAARSQVSLAPGGIQTMSAGAAQSSVVSSPGGVASGGGAVPAIPGAPTTGAREAVPVPSSVAAAPSAPILLQRVPATGSGPILLQRAPGTGSGPRSVPAGVVSAGGGGTVAVPSFPATPGSSAAAAGIPAAQAPAPSDELVYRISQSIDATLDAEIWEALRTVEALRRSETLVRSRNGGRPPTDPQLRRPPSDARIPSPRLNRPPTNPGSSMDSGPLLGQPPTDPGHPSTDPLVTGFAASPLAGHAQRGYTERPADSDEDGQDLRSATLLGPVLTATGDIASELDGEDPLPLSPEMAREAMVELASEIGHKTVEAPRDLFASVLAREESTGVVSQDTEAEAQLLYPTTGVVEPSVTAVASEDVHLPEPETGSLVDDDMAALLGRAFVQQLTGHLELRRDGARKVIFFEDGQPVQATSNVLEDRMVNMLLREGRLSAEQHARGVEMATASGRKMGAVLVDLGFIKQVELFSLVRRHYEQIVYALFAWESGEWFLGPEAASPSEKIRLSRNPVALILEGISRKYTVARLRGLLGGDDRIFRSVGVPGPDGLSQTGLTQDELHIAGLFDGVRTLREVHALSGAPAEKVYALAWTLLVVDLLERVETTTAGRSAAPRTGQDRDRRIDRERVMQRHALVIEGDYFQILGVARDASAHEIRRAYESLVNELAPGAFHADLAGELAVQLQAIRDVLDEALRVLSDDELRASYRAHLPPPPSPSGSSSGDAETVATG